jgi:deoxyribose-phosphate aldolase
VQPYQVPIAARLLEDYPVKVGTVVGFPHGSDSPEVKEAACIVALDCGAKEIDMVLNTAAMLDGDWETIEAEIEAAVRVCHEDRALLKVILEVCYLKPRYVGYACTYAAKLGADFVKTSTGFGPGGATPEAIKLMSKVVGDQCQVKASGGIKTYADAELYLDLGCTRLGSSLVEELMPYDLEGGG